MDPTDMHLPIERLCQSLRSNGIARFMEHFESAFPDAHMKDLTVDAIAGRRNIQVNGRWVVNFGSDSFLGLDRDPRIQEAIIRGVEKWGTHNGSSRAFASVRANVEAEERIAQWLGIDAALIYPSVTLANSGAIPGLVTKADVIVADEYAHNSIHEGNKIAKANGARVFTFRHNDADHLAETLRQARPYRYALITIDGVYSMSGELPPLKEMQSIALANDAILYVDDAHGTGVLGRFGRGTVYESLGTYENLFVVGSLSKAFSCLGGFVGCPKDFHRLLKIRSNSYIFGGPVAPGYLEGVCAVLDILMSEEYEEIRASLEANLQSFVSGIRQLGLCVLGGCTPIVSILVGDEEATFQAGKFLFDQGFYVQSVIFPAVPYHAGVLRVQINANHHPEEISRLIGAFGELASQVKLSDGGMLGHAA